jgi:nicotinamide mononucleotide (NMN) deamidase PncC
MRAISLPCATVSHACAARTAAGTRAATNGTSRGAQLTDEKGPAGKTDYHSMGTCHDVLRAPEAAR